MSNFFQQELRTLFADGAIIYDPVFVGRACIGALDERRQVRAEFVRMGYADHYEALRLTLLDNDQGVVDKLTLRFKDVWGKKKIPNNPYLRDGVNPYIWEDGSQTDWYASAPGGAVSSPETGSSGRPPAIIWTPSGYRAYPRRPYPNWSISVPRSGARWRKTSSLHDRKPKRCSGRETFRSAHT